MTLRLGNFALPKISNKAKAASALVLGYQLESQLARLPLRDGPDFRSRHMAQNPRRPLSQATSHFGQVKFLLVFHLHSISCPIGSRDKTRRGKQKTRVPGHAHMKLSSEENRQPKQVIDSDSGCCFCSVMRMWIVEHRHNAGANSELLHKYAELGPGRHDV